MDEDSIRLVLGRASELRSKLTNVYTLSSNVEAIKEDKEYKDKKEKHDTLLNIWNALESLEAQLSSLQALQQQQWYEKETFLAEIDCSRKRLLQKLKEYKGEDDLEVIQEAIAFASSTVEIENNDLLLPPYMTPPSHSIVSGSHFPFTQQIFQNGFTVNHPSNKLKGWRQVIGATAKTVLAFVGFVAVLSLSGFELPKISKNGNAFKVWGMSRDKKRMLFECPPGKVLLVEDGETRCLVKERVEIRFVSVATTPDVNYGCG